MYKNWASFIAQQAEEKKKSKDLYVMFEADFMKKITTEYTTPWEVIDGSESGFAGIKSANSKIVLTFDNNSAEEVKFVSAIVNAVNKL